MVRIGLEYFRLIAGTSFCPFWSPSTHVAYQEYDWFSSIRAFLSKTGAKLQIPMPKYFHPKCNGDICLMDRATEDRWSRAKIRSINRCRMFLRVIFLSDIAHGDGATIMRMATSGTRPLKSILSWPNQAKPSEKDWRIWRGFLRTEFLTLDTSTFTIRRSLGAWYSSADVHHRLWEKHLSPDGVVIRRQDTWRLFAFTLRYRRSGTVQTTSVQFTGTPPFCPVTFNVDTLQDCFFRSTQTHRPYLEAPVTPIPHVKAQKLRTPAGSSRLEILYSHGSIQWRLISGIW